MPLASQQLVFHASLDARASYLNNRVRELEISGWLTDREPPLTLLLEATGLSLQLHDCRKPLTIGVCFHEGRADHRRRYGGGRSQMLVRAIGLHRKQDLAVVDATAGMGGDSFVLATSGASVTMLERSAVLALMLEDALYLARVSGRSEELKPVLDRMALVVGEACEQIPLLPEKSAQVIYLDPMFPERRKTAEVKKEMRVLHRLLNQAAQSVEQREAEERELLQSALDHAYYRVVVKRPRLAPPLPGPEPGFSLDGKSTRYDIYPLKRFD